MLKILVQALGVLWYVLATVSLLSLLFAATSGVGEFTFADLLKVAASTAGAAAGLGLLFLQEWARRLAILLLSLYALRVLVAFLVVRGAEMDAFGAFLIAFLAIIYSLHFALLVLAGKVTRQQGRPFSKPRMVALVLGTAISGALAALILVGTPVPLESFGGAADGELDFLSQSDAWKMVEVVPIDIEGQKVKTRFGSDFVLGITQSDSLVGLTGIPPFKGVRVAVDPTRNVLLVGEWTLPGKAAEGNSPIVDDAAYRGVVFESHASGAVSGTAYLFVLEDGRLLIGFRHFSVYGKDVNSAWVGSPLRNPA